MNGGGTTWTAGLVLAIALAYAVVGGVFFGAGYVLGRLLL
jgi:hypothetical protein